VDNIGCQAHGWTLECPAHEYILGCRAQHARDRRHTNPWTNSTIAQSWPWKGGAGCRAPHYNTLHHTATYRNTRQWSGAQRAPREHQDSHRALHHAAGCARWLPARHFLILDSRARTASRLSHCASCASSSTVEHPQLSRKTPRLPSSIVMSRKTRKPYFTLWVENVDPLRLDAKSFVESTRATLRFVLSLALFSLSFNFLFLFLTHSLHV